jgi:hypothetical protein
MIRRIRAMRAARAERKSAKEQLKKGQDTKSNNIFISKQTPRSQSLVQPALTLTLSQEDEQHSVGPSVSSPASLPSISTLSSAHYITANTDMAEMLLGAIMEKEYYDMKTVLEELKESHDEVVAEKDQEIFATKVELAFCTEKLALTEVELETSKENFHSLLFELTENRMELKAKDEEILQTQSELETAKESLLAAHAAVVLHERSLQEKDEEIASLEHAMALAKRSAQAFVGFLTVGALFANDQ